MQVGIADDFALGGLDRVVVVSTTDATGVSLTNGVKGFKPAWLANFVVEYRAGQLIYRNPRTGAETARLPVCDDPSNYSSRAIAPTVRSWSYGESVLSVNPVSGVVRVFGTHSAEQLKTFTVPLVGAPTAATDSSTSDNVVRLVNEDGLFTIANQSDGGGVTFAHAATGAIIRSNAGGGIYAFLGRADDFGAAPGVFAYLVAPDGLTMSCQFLGASASADGPILQCASVLTDVLT